MITSSAIIFLDLDGVIVDFHSKAAERLAQKTGKPIPYDRDWPKGVSLMQYYEIKTVEEFWWLIHSDIFLHCTSTDFAVEIHRELYKYFDLENIYYCTNPGPLMNAARDKRDWVSDFARINSLYHHKIIMLEDKHLLAGPNTLLIDDYEKNVSGFTNAGGHGIIYPTFYNTFHPFARTTADAFQYFKLTLQTCFKS